MGERNLDLGWVLIVTEHHRAGTWAIDPSGARKLGAQRLEDGWSQAWADVPGVQAADALIDCGWRYEAPRSRCHLDRLGLSLTHPDPLWIVAGTVAVA